MSCSILHWELVYSEIKKNNFLLKKKCFDFHFTVNVYFIFLIMQQRYMGLGRMEPTNLHNNRVSISTLPV